jgi:hypothetical protein
MSLNQPMEGFVAAPAVDIEVAIQRKDIAGSQLSCKMN